MKEYISNLLNQMLIASNDYTISSTLFLNKGPIFSLTLEVADIEEK